MSTTDPHMSSSTKNGGRQIDPTENVIALTEAATKRQDDLAKQREVLATERKAHVEFVAELRAAHNKELRDSDSDRFVAQRREDQATALADKKTVLDAVQALAATTESVRLQLEKRVADTADTLSKAKSESDKATEIRIAALEKTAYTGAGEKAVADPQLADLLSEMKVSRITQAGAGGERRGGRELWMMITVVVSLLVGLGGLILRFGGM